jgi:hypothetical protein
MEWKDPATGTLMGYAVCEEECDDESILEPAPCDEVIRDVTEPLQVTVEWQHPGNGIMMGYALCDDNDRDIQIMNELFEEDIGSTDEAKTQSDASVESGSPVRSEEDNEVVSEESAVSADLSSDLDENMNVDSEANFDELECYESLQLLCEWKDPATGIMFGYGGCNEKDEEVEDEELLLENPMMHQASYEWEDPNSGASFAYECDNDSEFGDHLDALPKKTYEWEDPGTGALLGYTVCEMTPLVCDEDSDFEDGIQEGREETGEKETNSTDESDEDVLHAKTGYGYGYGYAVKPGRKARKASWKTSSMRSWKSRPLVLQLRTQHLRRVIKSRRFQK